MDKSPIYSLNNVIVTMDTDEAILIVYIDGSFLQHISSPRGCAVERLNI